MTDHNCERPRGRFAEARRNDRALLDAARRLLAHRGTDASVADIAAEAGVGVASLYRRYPTKEALVVALCRAAMADWNRAAERALDVATDDPWTALAEFIRAAVGFRAGVFERVAGSFQPPKDLIRLATTGQDLLEALVDRTIAAEVVRDDITVMDIRDLIAVFSNYPDDGHRGILEIAIAGLRPGSGLPPTGNHRTWNDVIDRWRST